MLGELESQTLNFMGSYDVDTAEIQEQSPSPILLTVEILVGVPKSRSPATIEEKSNG